MNEENAVISLEQEDELKKTRELVAQQVVDVKVIDQASYDAAAKFSEDIKRRIKDIENLFGPLKKKANEAHKAITTKEKECLAPLMLAFANVEGARSKWFEDQLRKANEAKRLKEEQERKIIEAEEEAERLRQEADEATQDRDQDVTDQTEQAALDAQEEVDDLKAEVEEPVVTDPIEEVAAPVATSGTVVNRPWKGRVTNMMDLVKAIAGGKASVNLVTINQSALNSLAKIEKDTLSVPGIEAYQVNRSSYGV